MGNGFWFNASGAGLLKNMLDTAKNPTVKGVLSGGLLQSGGGGGSTPNTKNPTPQNVKTQQPFAQVGGGGALTRGLHRNANDVTAGTSMVKKKSPISGEPVIPPPEWFDRGNRYDFGETPPDWWWAHSPDPGDDYNNPRDGHWRNGRGGGNDWNPEDQIIPDGDTLEDRNKRAERRNAALNPKMFVSLAKMLLGYYQAKKQRQEQEFAEARAQGQAMSQQAVASNQQRQSQVSDLLRQPGGGTESAAHSRGWMS